MIVCEVSTVKVCWLYNASAIIPTNIDQKIYQLHVLLNLKFLHSRWEGMYVCFIISCVDLHNHRCVVYVYECVCVFCDVLCVMVGWLCS